MQCSEQSKIEIRSALSKALRVVNSMSVSIGQTIAEFGDDPESVLVTALDRDIQKLAENVSSILKTAYLNAEKRDL